MVLSSICCGVASPEVSGLWVLGWICSGVDSCQQGLGDRLYSSLGLLHSGSCVVSLGLSFALLWGCSGSSGGGSPRVPVLWGAFGCLGPRSPTCLSQVQGAGLWLLTLAIAYFYGETLYTQARSQLHPQVFGFRC
ncbi:hypothetical protein AMECASPLE_011518 [Ameca splendens]|uniref:Uncharacterized protein n=1 Tax=Ameca splendens TaxID=208324 RepID=A0ABV0ZAX4_9TELE